MESETDKPNFFKRVFNKIISDAPESTEEVLEVLQSAENNGIVDEKTSEMLERVISFADLEVRDIMISRSQMDVIKIADNPQKIVDFIVDTAHSRFPVIGEDKDEVHGILHAKDLLQFFYHTENLNIRSLLREAFFVPESKSLNSLLQEFREKHIHIAMVVDEYGGISGLVTLEDVLEEIIGNIEDEFDDNTDKQNIIAIDSKRYKINAITEIKEFNQFFNTDFSTEEVDTIGGLIMAQLDRLPKKGEKIIIGQWRFTVARVDHRRIHILIAQKVED